MASTFGANALTDAFNVAFRIPNLFRRLFAEGAFSQAFVPVLAQTKEQYGEQVTRLLIDRVATVLSWALILASLIGVLCAPLLVWAMASGLKQDANSFDAAVVMTRWMFPYIALMSMVALASGVLNTWKRFAIPAFTPVLLNLSMISAAIWGAPWLRTHEIEPIFAMAAGVMVGGILQLGVQFWALKKLNLLPSLACRWIKIKAAWDEPGCKSVAKLMVPALFGVSVAQISLLINTQIASHLAPGSVSWLSYADRLMEFPTAMLGVALGVVLMPQLAAARANNDAAYYSTMLDWGLRLVVLLALPCAVALLIFAKPLVAVLYHYGQFSVRDVEQTTLAMMGWGVGLVGVIAIKVLAPGYYASQDIKTPVRIALVVLLITQLLNLFLVPKLQHAALSLSIGIGALINALFLLIGLLRRGSYKPVKGWGVFLCRVVLASALLAAFLIWATHSFNWTELQAQEFKRIGLMSLILLASFTIYFASLRASGLKLKQFVNL